MSRNARNAEIVEHWIGYATALMPVSDMRTRMHAQCIAVEHVGRVLGLSDLAAVELVAPIFAQHVDHV